tara:strand:- start:555 stop:674 length:120 start_codon:yes stop_codon:yes gene_type:complete
LVVVVLVEVVKLEHMKLVVAVPEVCVHSLINQLEMELLQ